MDNNRKVIVGLAGRAHSGKSSAASALQGMNFATIHVFSFAAPLKRMLLALGLTEAQLYGSVADKTTPSDLLCGKTPREAMITLGTEWGREMIGPNLWVNALKHRVGNSSASLIIIDDVRFQSEVQAIRELGGLVLGIHRPGLASVAPGHISESLDFEANGIPVAINDGTLADLNAKLLEFIVSFKP